MLCEACWIASIGVPAAMRPITGSSTEAASTGSADGGRPGRPPSMTAGLKPASSVSGSFTISMARARCARRRMKPRSSSAVISRWMPDFERRSSASFISSKDGGTPSRCSRRWMKCKRSYCLRVSIAGSLVVKPETVLRTFLFCVKNSFERCNRKLVKAR